jgi:hypothetical protein
MSKLIDYQINISISGNLDSPIAAKIRQHCEDHRYDPINLSDFGINGNFFVTGWDTSFSCDSKFIKFSAELTNDSKYWFAFSE